jgi:hypothetical protein
MSVVTNHAIRSVAPILAVSVAVLYEVAMDSGFDLGPSRARFGLHRRGASDFASP